jgi:hypothetical protein
MLGWWAGHFLWLDDVAGRWQLVTMILSLSLCSTTFYANTFQLQNYNVLGWIFFPIGLYGWLTNNWVISALAWLGASFCSFTVVVIAVILAFIYCLEIRSFLPFISVLPGGVSILSNTWPNFNTKGALDTFRGVLRAIGLSRAGAKYVRTTMMDITIRRLYFLIIYFQFILVLALIQKQIPLLLSASFIIWIINSKFARFSDEQTMQMLMLSVSTASLLKFNQFNVVILASYWILASPIPLLLGFQDQKCLIAVPRFRPFNISSLVKKMNHFLLRVAEGQQILMAFEDRITKARQIFGEEICQLF